MAGKTVLQEFVSILGWEVDDKNISEYEEKLEKIKDTTMKVVKVTAAAAVALTGYITVTNRSTLQAEALASAYGVSVEKLEAMGRVVEPLGLTFENVGDLIEEMNNKLGESKGLDEPMTAVKESLKILNLEYKDFKDLAPEKQFMEIIDAAKNLEDQQKAVAAVDILTGAEANRIVGYLRTQDESFQSLIDKQLQLNFLTTEGRKGAKDWSLVFNEIKTIATTILQEVAGLAGADLAPLLRSYVEWLKTNREFVKLKIKETVDTIVKFISIGIKGFVKLTDVLDTLIDKFGGLEQLLKFITFAATTLIGTRIASFFTTLVNQVGLMNVALGATKTLLLGLKVGAGLAIAYLLIEDFFVMLQGGDSVLGDVSEGFYNALISASEFAAELMGIDVDEFIVRLHRGFVRIGEIAQDIFNFYVDVYSSAAKIIADAVIAIFSVTTDDIKAAFDAVINAIEATIMNLVNRTKRWIGDILESIPEGITSTLGIDVQGLQQAPLSEAGAFSESQEARTRAMEAGAIDFLKGALESAGASLGLREEPIRASVTVPLTTALAQREAAQQKEAVERTMILEKQTESQAPITNNITNSPTLNVTQRADESQDSFVDRVLGTIQQQNEAIIANVTSGRKY